MLSVVLAVYNEQENLFDCLSSVKELADEIVIVDGGSSDATVSIAQKFSAKIIHAGNPPIFHVNKQKALDAAKGDWILQLDADERVTLELAKQIRKVLEGKRIEIKDKKLLSLFQKHQQNLEKRDHIHLQTQGEIRAYYIPRLNYFLGGYFRHGGVYPDGVIRLVKKGFAKFPCKSVHEQIQVQGKVGWLSENLIHKSDPTFNRYLQRANRYTSLTAQSMKKEKIPINLRTVLYYMFIKPMHVSILLFIRHKGFLDGFPGFIFAVFSGLHYALAFMKYWEQGRHE